MKDIEYFNGNGVRLSLSNLCFRGSNVVDIMDVVEDAKTADDLVTGINALDLLNTFSLDRETENYIRLTCADGFGNKKYLKVMK